MTVELVLQDVTLKLSHMTHMSLYNHRWVLSTKFALD